MSFDSMSPTFSTTFIGEFVELLTQFRNSEVQAITTYQVFLLDSDADYFYVGDTPTEISAAIKRTTVFSIEIVKPKNKERELLETFSIANKREN